MKRIDILRGSIQNNFKKGISRNRIMQYAISKNAQFSEPLPKHEVNNLIKSIIG